MRVHIGKVAAICFFHLCRLRQVRFVLTTSSMQRLVSALMISHTDYCNSVLYGLPAMTLTPLKRVLHAAVRLGSESWLRYHVTPAMKELHWLPIAYRIKYKLSHDARGKPSIYYWYIHLDIVSTSPWTASFARVRRFGSTPCADRVWNSFFRCWPYYLECSSKQCT